MNGKYAVFLWGSYLLTFIVLLWNGLSPMLRRQALKKQLAENEALGESGVET